MDNIVKLVFQSVFNGDGINKMNNALKTTVATSQKTIAAGMAIASSVAASGSAAGSAAEAVTKFVGAFAQLGAVGGIIAGVQIVLDKIGNYFIEKAEAMVKAMERANDRIRAIVDEMSEKSFAKVSRALDAATAKARRSATAFDTLAAAYVKVAEAQNATAKGEQNAVMSELTLEKSRAMAAVKDEADRAIVGAGYDVQIAEERRDNTKAEQDSAVESARVKAEIAAEQAQMALAREEKVEKAAAIANDELNRRGPKGADRHREKFEAAAKEAESALYEAVNDRIAKEAEAQAAAERLAQAQTAQAAAINEAERTVIEAKETERRLIAAKMEAEKNKEREEQKRRRAEAVQGYKESISSLDEKKGVAQTEKDRYSAIFDRSFDLWRDPEAAQSARDAAVKRDEDMKRFRKSVGGYHAKHQIDEAAELMRSGDSEALAERLAQWRKSSRFTAQTEQMVMAAAAEQNKGETDRKISEIADNTRDLAKKLDELLQAK